MPVAGSAMARARANVREGVVIQGLQDMQRVLRKAEDDLAPELKQRLKDAGENIVAPKARANAPRGRRPHDGKRLADTVKVGVMQRGASVYSTSVYGGVQNTGGRVGRNHATVLRRGDVSEYMTDAVKTTRGEVSSHVEDLLDWLSHELGS